MQNEAQPAYAALSRLRSLFRTNRVSGYYVLLGTSGVLGLLKGLVYAKIFGSETLGYYALTVLVATYADSLCHFGLYRGLECFLPTLYGAGRQDEAERLRNTAAGLILLAIIGLFLLLITAYALLPLQSQVVRTAMLPAGFLTGSSVLFGLAVQDLRSRTSTLRLGTVMLMRSAFCLLVGTVLGWKFGYCGSLIGEASVILGLFIFVIRLWCHDFRFIFRNFQGLGEVTKVGCPLMLKTLANDLLLNLDRWGIAASLGVFAVGQYAFASIIITVGMLIHGAIWMQVGPHAAFAYGKSGDIRSFLRLLHQISFGILLAFTISWLPFLLLTRHVLPLYFGEYDAGIALLPILYWGVLFQVLSQYEWVPMSLKRTGILLSMTIVCGVTTALLYGVAVLLRWPLSAFAWIFVAGRAMMWFGQLVIALWVGTRAVARYTS